MKTSTISNLTEIITLIRACYGRFSSYRIAKAGMQELTELYQFVINNKKRYPLFLCNDLQ